VPWQFILLQFFPSIIDNLILMAPTGFPVSKPNFGYQLAQIPMVPELLTKFFLAELLQAFLLNDLKALGTETKIYKETNRLLTLYTENPDGFRRSLLSTLRSFGVYDTLTKRGLLEDLATKIPNVFAIWGTNDTVCPFSNAESLTKAIPQTQLLPIPGAGHFLISGNSGTKVFEETLKFIQKNQPKLKRV